MTDGQNDVSNNGGSNGFNGTIYNAYGYASPHLTWTCHRTTSSRSGYNLDQKEIALCNNIKAVTDANGNPGRILLYTIGYGKVITNNSLEILQRCATDPNSTYFYNPTADELVPTFQNIAQTLSRLRIAH